MQTSERPHRDLRRLGSPPVLRLGDDLLYLDRYWREKDRLVVAIPAQRDCTCEPLSECSASHRCSTRLTRWCSNATTSAPAVTSAPAMRPRTSDRSLCP